MKFITSLYAANGIIGYIKRILFNIKRFSYMDRKFYENDLMPERTWKINGNHNGNSKLDWSSLYNSKHNRLFKPRTEIPPKVWITKEEKGYSLFDIIFESARMAYSSKQEGKYLYSTKELTGDHLTDYGLRKIASELNLELRVTKVSEEEKQNIINAYNNLRINKKRGTNDALVRLLHRDIKTIYNVLNSSESEINWKKRRGAKIIQLDDYREPQLQPQLPSLEVIG